MTDKEKQENKEMFQSLAENYFATFAIFLSKTGSTEQAFRLTKDMFSSILNQNNKPDSFSVFWDK